MSHIVTIKTEVRDAEAVRAACKRLALEEPVQGTARLFEGEATGLLVKLPGWVYPVVLDTATDKARYDNYGGDWGAQKHLDRFVQTYAICKATIKARKRGHSVHLTTSDRGPHDHGPSNAKRRRQRTSPPHPAYHHTPRT